MNVSPRLAELIEAARRARMTDADRAEQRVSFAYGNANLENPAVTLDLVAAVAARMRAGPAE